MPLLTRAGAYFLSTQIPQDKGLGLTRIPLYRGFKAHTDPTDLTGFARLMLNLTEALRSLAPLGSHRFNEIQQKKFVLICGRKNTPI